MFKQLKNIGLSALSSILIAFPSQAAEKINYIYGLISVVTLNTIASSIF